MLPPQLRAEEAHRRAEQRARRQQLYWGISSLFHVDPREQWITLRMIAKWGVLGGIVGVLAGTASALFLTALQWATNTRIANPDFLFVLPIAGFVVGWIYYRFAGAAARGNNLVIEQVNPQQGTPSRQKWPRWFCLGRC